MTLHRIPMVPLYCASMALDNIDNDGLKRIIVSRRHKNKPGSEPSDANYEDIHLDPNVLRYDALDKLLAETETAVQKVSCRPLKLQGGVAWATIRSKGQCLAYHDHDDPDSPSADGLSFVYYVQANSDSMPLIFPISIHAHRFDYALSPNTGQLHIFPSFLPHYTGQENAPTKDRIVIAGNFVEV